MHFTKTIVIPLLVTVILHVVLVMVMFVGWESKPQTMKLKTPNFVQAKLVTLESKTQQNKKKEEHKKIVDLTKKRKEKERQNKLAEQKRTKDLELKKQAEKKERDLKDKAKKEAEQRKAQEQLQRKKEKEAFDRALEKEQMALAEESLAVAAQSYMAAIAARIEQNWSRPPSARNGMECQLKIKLVPTGRVISVDVVRSSGNIQFDRSAEQAVKKVEQFPEIKEMKPDVFERYYRELTLVFRPQDLRQ